jgi:hypothetical protein
MAQTIAIQRMAYLSSSLEIPAISAHTYHYSTQILRSKHLTSHIFHFLNYFSSLNSRSTNERDPPLWSSGQSSWLHNGDVLCFLWDTNWIYICYVEESRPPLWSSGQSSWLQIQRSRVRFPCTTKKSSGVWNGVHSASWVQLRSYLIEK